MARKSLARVISLPAMGELRRSDYRRCAALSQTLEAIANADLITLGPGSLFTSIVPNVLVHGIPEALTASRALKVSVCKLMTEPNETLQLKAADHVSCSSLACRAAFPRLR